VEFKKAEFKKTKVSFKKKKLTARPKSARRVVRATEEKKVDEVAPENITLLLQQRAAAMFGQK
jgi:hypothetical protein